MKIRHRGVLGLLPEWFWEIVAVLVAMSLLWRGVAWLWGLVF